MVKYDEFDGGKSGAVGKSVKKLTKSCQKVEESSKVEKLQKHEELQRSSVRGNVYQSIGSPSMKNSSFRQSSDSFSNSFCWAQKLSQYHFWIDYQPSSPCQSASLVLLLWAPSYQVFICGMHVSPPLLQLWDTLRALRHQDDSKTHYARSPSAQFWRCAPEEDVPAQNQYKNAWWVRRMSGRRSKKLCNHQGLSYVLKIIR